VPRLSTNNYGRRRLSRLAFACACLIGALVLSGCGYNIGSPYSAEIRTIHVPVFTSDTNRRGLEYQITEAVQKQIQMRTHFRLVKEPQADTRLTGKLVTSRKNVLGLTQNPRELQLNLQVEITWVDQRTGEILRQQPIDIPPELVQIASQAEFAPEVGHSLATAEQQAIDRLARTIVDLMEMPWPS
jgi:hypothetical protein